MNRFIIGCCILLALLLCTPAEGKNIYKFQDENGIWHFTDRPPEESRDAEIVFMEREPEPRIQVRMEGAEGNPVYILFNDYWGPAEVELRLSDAVNVMSEPELPARFVVPGQSEKTLVGLGALDPKQSFGYRLHLTSVPGAPITQLVLDQSVYPPFPAGEGFLISQGFNGTKTHNKPDSVHAVDIVMPVGTTVLAARDGVVMDVEEDFNRAGTDLENFGDKANHVRILHDDGTMALYAHLDLASVSVRPGARVHAGQVIAHSGNTGFSTGPHLHFVIQQNVGLEIRSVPFRFFQADGLVATPVEKQELAGVLPGR
ncbi:MAG: M23 family metallopeptidase [Lysobacterales bacterium]